METQKFNVLCVTKRMLDPDGHALFHRNITGEAEVSIVVFEEKYGVKIASRTMVRFRNVSLPLTHVRSGLNGSAVTIGIECHEDPEFDCWELYTDTPIPGSSKTPEQLQQAAEFAISRSHG